MKTLFTSLIYLISFFSFGQNPSGFFSKSNHDKEPIPVKTEKVSLKKTEQKETLKPLDTLSKKTTFLKSPVDNARISSSFTESRFHPVTKVWKAHHGTDFAAPYGAEIKSTASGVVIAENYTKANGYYVKIEHDSVYTTQYLHMSKIKVTKGQIIKQGDVIGLVGSSGLATGPHVCYRFWKNGVQVDPFDLKLEFDKNIPNEKSEKVNPEFKKFITGFFKTTN